jgi:hypothetical protein
MKGIHRPARLGWHLLLAVLMLLMQHAALRHAFQHSPREDGQAAHGTLCKECLAYAATDAVASTSTPVIAPQVVHDHQPVFLPAQRHAPVALGYQSRAPPRLSVTA